MSLSIIVILTPITSSVSLIQEVFKISSLLFWDALSFSFTGNAWLFLVSTFLYGSSTLKSTKSLKVFWSALKQRRQILKDFLDTSVYYWQTCHDWIFEKMLLCNIGMYVSLECFRFLITWEVIICLFKPNFCFFDTQ